MRLLRAWLYGRKFASVFAICADRQDGCVSKRVLAHRTTEGRTGMRWSTAHHVGIFFLLSVPEFRSALVSVERVQSR